MWTGNRFGKSGMFANLVLSIISFLFSENPISRANYMSWAGPWLARLVQAKMTVQPGIPCTWCKSPWPSKQFTWKTFSLASWDSGITLLGSWQTGLRFSHIILLLVGLTVNRLPTQTMWPVVCSFKMSCIALDIIETSLLTWNIAKNTYLWGKS